MIKARKIRDDKPKLPDLALPETKVHSAVPAAEGKAVPHDPCGYDVALWITQRIARNSVKSSPRKPKRRSGRNKGVSYRGPGDDPRDPKPVGAVLGDLVSEKGWKTDIKLRQIWTDWPGLVGEINASHCEPVSFNEHVLVIKAQSSAWATQLRQLTKNLMTRLNAELGQGSVQKIIIEGPNAPSWRRGKLSVRGGRGPRDTYG